MDAESRRRFKDAFEAVNEHFKGLFRVLFGGGQGEMRLTEETNLAESGIDILASPPGKKLQNVALLSGGEKSLTAMALLMAIFRYTSSPFCILDEVDAAGRTQHPAADAADQGDVAGDAVHRHHARQADDGECAGFVWRDDAGAWVVEAGQRTVRSCAGGESSGVGGV